MDSVKFWGAFGALVVALGLFPGAVGVAQVTPKWSGLPSNGWFDVAVAFWAVGLLALLRMAWLRTAHLHAEGHRCPDPEAHSERPRRSEDVNRCDEGVASGSLPQGRPFTSAQTSPAVDVISATSGPRVICTLSPLQLTRLYSKGSTDIQSESLVAQYKGQWREVSASVEQVTPQNEYICSVSGKDSDQVSVSLFFEPNAWSSRLQGLMPGDPIRSVGQVRQVTRTQVIFACSELL